MSQDKLFLPEVPFYHIVGHTNKKSNYSLDYMADLQGEEEKAILYFLAAAFFFFKPHISIVKGGERSASVP